VAEPEVQHTSDAELLALLAVDQSAALGALYDRYARLVYGLALSVVGSAAEAEDLTQEVFLALCGRCDYDPKRGTLSAFLVTMTRSRGIDKLRGRSRKTKLLERFGDEVAPSAPAASPLEMISLMQCSTRVRDALAQLPEMQRRVLEMAYYKGMSQTEIAEELEAPLGTVKSWSRKGLFALKDLLGDLAG
jgi:RNA polymerase sigma-70 factor (ECF subfamily)